MFVTLYLTTITVELGFLCHFELLKLKTCSLYHENLLLQKVKVISSQVLNNFFSHHLPQSFLQLDLDQEIVHLLIIKVMAIPVVEFKK